MISHRVDLTTKLNLIEVSEKEAEKYFESNKSESVYIKLAKSVWIQVTNKFGDSLIQSEGDIHYFIKQKLDDDKIIVSRHPGVVEWFRKYKGIKAKAIATARPKDLEGKKVYTSGMNVHLLSKAAEAYVLTTDSVTDRDFDFLSADELNGYSPRLCLIKATLQPLDINADIR